MPTQANWLSFKLEIPGREALEKIREVLETLMVFLEIARVILETIKIFLIDFGNPVRVLVQIIIFLVTALIDTLKRTGLYAWYNVPDGLADPSFKAFAGGFNAFSNRFKGSLVNLRDANRPQPISGFLEGGFILFVVDVVSPEALLALIAILKLFFGDKFLHPEYPPPANVKVFAANTNGDPLLSVASVFADPPKAIIVEWELPSTTPPGGDPGYKGLVTQMSTEFKPPKYLVERADIPPVQPVDIGATGASLSGKCGPVVRTFRSNFTDPRSSGNFLQKTIPVPFKSGEPFIIMSNYTIIDSSNDSLTFFLGQLGTFRFIDKDIEMDHTYFYRVRAFSGDLELSITGVSPTGSSLKQPKFPKPVGNPNEGGVIFQEWPGATKPIMGRPSPMFQARLMKLPPNFDVEANLKALFLTAISLNFHLPAPSILDSDNELKIGQGSLTDLAGPLNAFQAIPIIGKGFSSGDETTKFSPDAATGLPPQQPWQLLSVRYQAARLTSRFASLLLEQGTSAIEGFRKLMQDAMPAGPITISWPGGTPEKGPPVPFGTPSTLEKMVFAFTLIDKAVPPATDGTVSQGTAKSYGDAFASGAVRKNVLKVVYYLKAFGFQAAPPNWTSIALLRDLIPWSAQLLYAMLAKIQALLDAFNSIIQEIIKFIDLLLRKIDALEKFIQFLIDIINFLEQLNISFSILFVPSIEGEVGDWMATYDNAGGDKPTSGDFGWTAGICFAYLAPAIASLVKALSAIF